MVKSDTPNAPPEGAAETPLGAGEPVGPGAPVGAGEAVAPDGPPDGPSEPDDPTLDLGEKLRQSRKAAGLTMQVVADGAGLSVGFISQVERGLTVPSLSSLRAISAVLGQPIGSFLDQPGSSADPTRADQRQTYSVANGPLSYERLSARFPGSTLRSVIIHEPPGHRNEPISHEGEELFYMLKGALTVEVEGRRRVLHEGDSLHFDSRKVHSTWNHTAETAAMLWCGTMDVFGEDTIDPVHKAPGTTPTTPKGTRPNSKGDTT